MVIASLPIESRLGLRLGPIVERRLRVLERKEWLLSKSRATCLADRLRMVIHTSAARGAPSCSRTRHAVHVGGVAVEAAVITNVTGWQRLVPAKGQRHDSRALRRGVPKATCALLFEAVDAARRTSMSDPNLAALLSLAKDVKMSAQEREAQRISFAYGNTKIENEDISRSTVEQAARDLASIR